MYNIGLGWTKIGSHSCPPFRSLFYKRNCVAKIKSKLLKPEIDQIVRITRWMEQVQIVVFPNPGDQVMVNAIVEDKLSFWANKLQGDQVNSRLFDDNKGEAIESIFTAFMGFDF